MVYNPEGEKGKGQEWILVNPRVISSGKGQDTMEEGCLSFQDISKDMYIKGNVIVSLFVLPATILSCAGCKSSCITCSTDSGWCDCSCKLVFNVICPHEHAACS